MTKDEIKKACGFGEFLDHKDFADIAAAQFLFDRFDSEESVCRWIKDNGIVAFRRLMEKVERYHRIQKQIKIMMDGQSLMKELYGIRI